MTASSFSQNPGGAGVDVEHDPQRDAGRADTPDLDDLRQEFAETADVAARRSRGFAAAARAHALDYADSRKSDAADSVAGLAHSLRDSGKTFDDRPNIKAFFDSAADGLDDLATTIEQRGFQEFYEEAEAFARRSPVAVAAASFAAGLLLARFVKSSGSRSTGTELDRGYDRERI